MAFVIHVTFVIFVACLIFVTLRSKVVSSSSESRTIVDGKQVEGASSRFSSRWFVERERQRQLLHIVFKSHFVFSKFRYEHFYFALFFFGGLWLGLHVVTQLPLFDFDSHFLFHFSLRALFFRFVFWKGGLSFGWRGRLFDLAQRPIVSPENFEP